MKIEENIRLCRLFDLYSPLLSQSQQDIMKDYLLFNLTNSEIAENRKVSRQAVKDAITKATKKLEEYEKKLGFLVKVDIMEEEIAKLKGREK